MQDPDVRLSDDERQEALDALSEHVRTGRLDVDEFGDRSARVTAARRRGELEELFADLPQPRPSVLKANTPPAPPTSRELRPARRRVAELALPIAAVLAAVLFFTVAKTVLVFVIPVAIALLGPTLFGKGRR